jgi:hypothetical protein
LIGNVINTFNAKSTKLAKLEQKFKTINLQLNIKIFLNALKEQRFELKIFMEGLTFINFMIFIPN